MTSPVIKFGENYYDDNLTLLEFFHTECSHCNTQIPTLKEFYSEYSDEVNVFSIGCYVDFWLVQFRKI